jgi:hypothetical protein
MTETETTTALSNLSPEQQKRLERDRSHATGQFPTIPLIRLANKDAKQAPEGEYFIETRDGEEKVIRKIGKTPEVTILYKTVTYSYFDETSNELVAWTSDIHGYGDNKVTLFLKEDGKVSIDFDGTFNAFKDYRIKFDIIDPISKKKKGSLLTFKNVLYVLFEGIPYKMFVSNASAAGILDGKPSFEKAQKNSMQYYMDMCYQTQKALYDFTVTMDSLLIDGGLKPFYIMQFASVVPLEGEDLMKALDASMNTEKAIYMIDEMRKNAVLEKQHEVTVDQAKSVFGDDLSAVL